MTALTELAQLDDSAQDDIPRSSIFDPVRLVERCMGQTSTACSLLGLFRDRLPGTVAEISNCLLTLKDVPSALSVLHMLKGNAGNLCAGRLFQAATRLDHALRNGEFNVTGQLMELQEETDRFLRALPSDLETLLTKP